VLVDGKLLLSEGFFRGYSGWTVAVVVVNSLGGVSMACILKFLDNIACVYSNSMAMMLTTLLSIAFFAFSPSLAFGCGLGVLVASMYLYHHPLAQVDAAKASPRSTRSSEDGDTPPTTAPSLQLKSLTRYKEVPTVSASPTCEEV